MRKQLKWVSVVILCFVGFAVSGIAPVAAQGNEQRDEQPEELAPSPLEAFAARSTATVVWSKQIGVLESQESRATVTALIVEDPTSTPGIMRGLRIDLVHTHFGNKAGRSRLVETPIDFLHTIGVRGILPP